MTKEVPAPVPVAIRVETLPNQTRYTAGDVLQSAGRDASPVTAAEFLKNFRPKSGTWAHLDIAGTGWNSRGIKGPTGRPASLLLSYLIDLSRGIIRDRRGGTVLAFDAEGPADGFGVEGKGEE